MQQQEFIGILKKPKLITAMHLDALENLVKEYPFFETAHLLYTKGLHRYDAIKYPKQLRKTAIIANSRTVLYELLHKKESIPVLNEPIESAAYPATDIARIAETKEKTSPITITNNEIKVVYVNTIAATPTTSTPIDESKESPLKEMDIIKTIENQTEVPVPEFNVNILNQSIEEEIKKGVLQSYVETVIIKTPELNKEVVSEPSTFGDWLKTIEKESSTFQITTKTPNKSTEDKEEKKTEIEKKPSFFAQNKDIINKIIETDPGRIKLGNTKFFTPNIEAKQSLLENEHLITETLAKIYALQGNISKAIRAYEILSLKFPQKSVYFTTLIEKLKNK